ncbi:MAG TPA: tryptophan halogenase family protein, partial [Sphingomicrobium sp.]|nr:tryptophan halogenase family protein [Sphingomicrobium sp.]
MSAPMAHVVIAGGGIVAWSAAAALRRQIPSLEVTVVSCPVPPDALADRMISTLPSIAGFHEDIGLADSDTLHRAKSGLRLGTIFEGWATGRAPYVHAYGSYGTPVEGIPFYQLWLRAREEEQGIPPFDHFSIAAQLGRAGRIGSAAVSAPESTQIGYGLNLTLERYHALMRDYALHLGAIERSSGSFEPRLRGEDGFIEALALDDGADLKGDLFVDCSGPCASIRSALGERFDDWSSWLPCNRLILVEGSAAPGPPLLDISAACSAGWKWEASSPSRSSRGIVFSKTHVTSDEALAQLGGAVESAVEVGVSSGRWAQPWLRNCVAIGDAAVAAEPLEWASLHLAHSQLDRLISMMPGRDCAPVELAEYNRQCGDEADRVRDFICMHYVTARRDDGFWKDASAIDPPDSLAHTLALFAERGRLPYYEEETFSRDSWAAVLLGQGIEPVRIDPLADSLPADQIRSELV